jgi:predicted amidohydrolase
VRVLLASIACEKGDLDANRACHVQALEAARTAGCELAVFPEFSLTGSVDPVRHADRAIAVDAECVRSIVAAAHNARVGALFGLGERHGDEPFITQVYAVHGEIAGVQRKRHLGQDEHGFARGSETARFELGAATFGAILCAESRVDTIWDAHAAAGAAVLFLCSAPGLCGRRTTEAEWRDGWEWWESSGLADARRQARRLRTWVAMATQAGSTVDEDFPGIAALVAPTGQVVQRLPDWRPGTLVVDIPVTP